MSTKIKGQPDTVAKTDPAKPDRQTQPVELNADTLASAELLIEQGARLEPSFLKHSISSASVMCAQGRLFGKAKKVLRNKGAREELIEKTVDGLYAKFGLAKSTMNRRIQLWDEVVSREIIDEDLRHEIETSPILTPDLLAKMELCIGSISGTELMREFGILPPLEEASKHTNTSTVKERIHSTVDNSMEQLENLINGKAFRKEVQDDNVIEAYRTQFQQLRTVARKFKSIAEAPPASEHETVATSTESSEIKKLKRESIDLKKQLIDAEEHARAVTEA